MKDCQIRAAALTGYAELVKELGFDPEVTLGRTGLCLNDLTNPDRLVSYRRLIQAIEDGGSHLGCADFGLQLMAKQDLTFLGPLAMAIQTAGTVREGFEVAAKHMAFHTPGVSLRFAKDSEHPDCERIEFHLLITHLPMVPQVVEHAVAHMLNTLNVLSNGQVKPVQICMRHAAVAPKLTYQQHLGCIPVFRASFDGLLVNAQSLRRNVDSQNPQLNEFVERFILGMMPAAELNVADQVESVLEQLMPSGQGSLQSVARVLRMHPRTLQRHLKNENARLESLQNEVKKRQTLKLLEQTHIPLERVAHLLGFAEQAVLNRACKRWFGQTPLSLRKNLLATGLVNQS